MVVCAGWWFVSLSLEFGLWLMCSGLVVLGVLFARFGLGFDGGWFWCCLVSFLCVCLIG